MNEIKSDAISRRESDIIYFKEVEDIISDEEVKFLRGSFLTRDEALAFCHNHLNKLNVFKLKSETNIPKCSSIWKTLILTS
jgi:hypothetical protein